jgi:hypothetical protein
MTALDTAKERLSVMDAWRLLRLAGQPKVGANHSPFREDKSPSLSIFKDGRRWKDHGTGEGGSVVDFVAVAKNLPTPEAVREVLRLADLAPREMPKTEAVHPPVPAWGGESRAKWREGVEWLSNQKAIREKLASWRGWPAAWVDALNESGLLGCPKVGGERGTAFSVVKPAKNGTETIGFHVRLKAAGWRYEPKGIRALPFVMGATESRKLIITEGQWDAVTLAGCAGWLDRHEAWPEEVCLLGIRGAGGTGPFLEVYGEILSRTRPEVVVIRDNDLPGERWRTTFLPALSQIVGVKAVRCVRMAEGKDINETHQKNPITPQEVAEILRGKK